MRWILGDIHGMFAPLEALVSVVEKLDGDARFFLVGDYVNRGPDSRRVVDFVLSMRNVSAARGNHDDVLDLILNEHWKGGEENAFEPLAACSWFLQHGLEDTLLSYGLDDELIDQHREDPTSEMLRYIRSAFPTAHRKFFRDLPVVIEEPGLFVAHAFWPPEESNDVGHVNKRLHDDAEMCHRVIWERWKNVQILADKPWRRRGFFGHTPVSNYPPSMREGGENVPVVGQMVTLIDTAVALGRDGRLSAVCAEDERLVQVDRAGKVVR